MFPKLFSFANSVYGEIFFIIQLEKMEGGFFLPNNWKKILKRKKKGPQSKKFPVLYSEVFPKHIKRTYTSEDPISFYF